MAIANLLLGKDNTIFTDAFTSKDEDIAKRKLMGSYTDNMDELSIESLPNILNKCKSFDKVIVRELLTPLNSDTLETFGDKLIEYGVDIDKITVLPLRPVFPYDKTNRVIKIHEYEIGVLNKKYKDNEKTYGSKVYEALCKLYKYTAFGFLKLRPLEYRYKALEIGLEKQRIEHKKTVTELSEEIERLLLHTVYISDTSELANDTIRITEAIKDLNNNGNIGKVLQTCLNLKHRFGDLDDIKLAKKYCTRIRESEHKTIIAGSLDYFCDITCIGLTLGESHRASSYVYELDSDKYYTISVKSPFMLMHGYEPFIRMYLDKNNISKLYYEDEENITKQKQDFFITYTNIRKLAINKNFKSKNIVQFSNIIEKLYKSNIVLRDIGMLHIELIVPNNIEFNRACSIIMDTFTNESLQDLVYCIQKFSVNESTKPFRVNQGNETYIPTNNNFWRKNYPDIQI